LEGSEAVTNFPELYQFQQGTILAVYRNLNPLVMLGLVIYILNSLIEGSRSSGVTSPQLITVITR